MTMTKASTPDKANRQSPETGDAAPAFNSLRSHLPGIPGLPGRADRSLLVADELTGLPMLARGGTTWFPRNIIPTGAAEFPN
jgi:hypothetical protein